MEKAVTGGKPPVLVKHFKNGNTTRVVEHACIILCISIAKAGGGSKIIFKNGLLHFLPSAALSI